MQGVATDNRNEVGILGKVFAFVTGFAKCMCPKLDFEWHVANHTFPLHETKQRQNHFCFLFVHAAPLGCIRRDLQIEIFEFLLSRHILWFCYLDTTLRLNHVSLFARFVQILGTQTSDQDAFGLMLWHDAGQGKDGTKVRSINNKKAMASCKTQRRCCRSTSRRQWQDGTKVLFVNISREFSARNHAVTNAKPLFESV